MISTGTPAARALAVPVASDLFEKTTAISAGKSRARAASISALMFEPRPEIRMATRRFIGSQSQVEVVVVDDALFTGRFDDVAEMRYGLAAARQHLHHPR